MKRDRSGALFVATTFASAFLIFLVQPMVAKRILPWFGGVPAVWSLCLAFYQTTLFAGYAYAHLLLRRASPAHQLAIHAIVIASAVLALPVLPGDAWRPEGGGDPSAAILAMLLANVALPFIVLAATGPLVAAWFARRHPARSPYPLYAVSNAGSLLALLAYPFALEPRLSLSATGGLWSGAFVTTGVALFACAELARRATIVSSPAAMRALGPGELRPDRVALWLLLAACAVVVLMGVTNQLTLDVASVPFLWILPLAIYLTTLILCFGAERAYRRAPYVAAAALAYFLPQIATAVQLYDGLVIGVGGPLVFEVARHAILLFSVCMVLHGELYRLRPPPRSLTTFYLCTSGGGALGGIAVGLAAPRVFDGLHELGLGVGLGCLLLLAACRDDARGWLGRSAPAWRWAPAIASTAFLLFTQASGAFARPAALLDQQRNFFGLLRVVQNDGATSRYRALMHGSTLHGVQLEASPDRPTAYFGLHTGIGMALQRAPADPPAQIGVIGLGIGTLAAYGRAGDRMRFFEIDPAVIRVARDPRYFTYVARSPAEVETVEGDGRIALARERARGARRFDYLIVDAYSSGAAPVHLLTREALALYLDSLEEHGLLAFNVTSRYFDLTPMLGRLAADAGVHAVRIESVELPEETSGSAAWIFLSRDEARIRELADRAEESSRRLGLPESWTPVRYPMREALASGPFWTDDYSDLVRALSPTGSRARRFRTPTTASGTARRRSARPAGSPGPAARSRADRSGRRAPASRRSRSA